MIYYFLSLLKIECEQAYDNKSKMPKPSIERSIDSHTAASANIRVIQTVEQFEASLM